ncbi:MAG: hypothetical protein WHX52_22965 [Anaerolineae bacterium]
MSTDSVNSSSSGEEQFRAPLDVHRRPLCQALAGSPPGGNGFVLAGDVAVTAPSWRVDCSRWRLSLQRPASPERK